MGFGPYEVIFTVLTGGKDTGSLNSEDMEKTTHNIMTAITLRYMAAGELGRYVTKPTCMRTDEQDKTNSFIF